MTPKYPKPIGPSPDYALRECIFRAIPSRQSVTYRDIMEAIAQDYGTVCDRKLSRYLVTMCNELVISRTGQYSRYRYHRVAVILPQHPRESFVSSPEWIAAKALPTYPARIARRNARRRARKLLPRSRSHEPANT